MAGTLFLSDCADLKFYKQSLKGAVQDYIISFIEDQTDLPQIISTTMQLFEQLMNKFKDRRVSARLVAKVNFIHINQQTGEMEERSYHFPSFSCEKVIHVKDFYERHMNKIASRLISFNCHGSNLLLKNIAHIHILLVV